MKVLSSLPEFAQRLRRYTSKLALIPFLTLAPLCGPVSAESFNVSSGHSAHWYSPERSGEGLVLEVLDESSALVYWFTYDEEGEPRWLIDVGEISGSEILFDELTVSSGGEFGPEFDPDSVEYEVVGEAVLSFLGCDEAEFSYSAFGHAQTLAMTRLSETMAAGCDNANGKPGFPAQAHAGQTGSWYDPGHAGEGYTLQWLSRNQAVLVWFTYDTQGNQYWMIGTGERTDGSITFPSLQSGSGGRFGESYNEDDVIFENWGSLTLTLNCEEGAALYESEVQGFGAGQLDLERLSAIDELDCPWEAPTFSDLFAVEYEEIPLHEDGQPDNIQPQEVALTGKVVALNPLPEGIAVWTWEPGDEELSEIPGARRWAPVLIKPDGSELLAHDISPYTPAGQTGGLPMVWNGTSWSEFPVLSESNALVQSYSQGGQQATGAVKVDVDGGRNRAWRISESGGQDVLPIDPNMVGARGEVISDDGSVVVGKQIYSDGVRAYDYASIWIDGGQPEILRDQFGSPLAYPFACSSDCSVVAGGYQGGPLDPEHPNFEQAWIWVESLGVRYLPRIEGAVERAGIPPYVVQDTTSDGSMIVGRYLVDFGGVLGSRAFIWTQHTGMVTIKEVFEANDVGDDDWFRMDRISLSPNGEYLLISGFHFGDVGSPQGQTRGALLRLVRK